MGARGPRRAESPRQRGRFLPQEPLRAPSGCRQEKTRWQQLPNEVLGFPSLISPGLLGSVHAAGTRSHPCAPRRGFAPPAPFPRPAEFWHRISLRVGGKELSSSALLWIWARYLKISARRGEV